MNVTLPRGLLLWPGLALALAAAGGLVRQGTAADHHEAPLITQDRAADITDTYVFLSPNDPAKTVLIMAVEPLITPGEVSQSFFDPDVLYQFKIDTNGDAIEDKVLYMQPMGFGRDQTVEFRGPAPPIRPGVTTIGPPPSGPFGPLIGEVPLSVGATAIVRDVGGTKIFAGVRDDPFFFDLLQFLRISAGQASGFRDPGVDTFAGFNVLALAIEIDTDQLTDRSTDRLPLGVWGTTSR